LEDVLVLLVDVLKDLWRQAEVLCYNGLGCMLNPLVQEESRILGKVTTVKDQQEFGSVFTQALERVWVARWEVPQISLLQVIDERTTISVQRCNTDLAFVKLVVVQFSSHHIWLT
jgi:hypothetical protein